MNKRQRKKSYWTRLRRAHQLTGRGLKRAKREEKELKLQFKKELQTHIFAYLSKSGMKIPATANGIEDLKAHIEKYFDSKFNLPEMKPLVWADEMTDEDRMNRVAPMLHYCFIPPSSKIIFADGI